MLKEDGNFFVVSCGLYSFSYSSTFYSCIYKKVVEVEELMKIILGTQKIFVKVCFVWKAVDGKRQVMSSELISVLRNYLKVPVEE